jgi:hypothetical protein
MKDPDIITKGFSHPQIINPDIASLEQAIL